MCGRGQGKSPWRVRAGPKACPRRWGRRFQGGPWARGRSQEAVPGGRGGLREASPLRAGAEPESRPGKHRASTRSSAESGNQPAPGGVWSDRQGETVAPETGGVRGTWPLGPHPRDAGRKQSKPFHTCSGRRRFGGPSLRCPTPAHRLHFSHPWHQRR